MKTLISLSVYTVIAAMVFTQSALADIQTYSCSIENIHTMKGFTNPRPDRPILLVNGDSENTYIDFSDPSGIWNVRRAWISLEIGNKENSPVVMVGINEDTRDQTRNIVGKNLSTFVKSKTLKGLSFMVSCIPVKKPYIFIHSQAGNLAVKVPAYDISTFDLKRTSERSVATIRSLDELLTESCIIGDNHEAYFNLMASNAFHHQDTLKVEDNGGLSYRYDKEVSCNHYNSDDNYCDSPNIEKNAGIYQIPACK